MTYTVYDYDGNELTAGLQEHEARRVAQAISDRRDEPVWLDDGEALDWDAMERFDPRQIKG